PQPPDAPQPHSPQQPPHRPRRNRSKRRGKRRKGEKSARGIPSPPQPLVEPFRAQHLALAQQELMTEFGRATVTVNELESPLVWLARRRGRDGRALIEPHQLQAGERLRADFTQAHLMPRTTSNWSSPLSSAGGFAEGAGVFTETMIAARQRVHRALDAVGPEFAGPLVDVCCFLKGLAEV